MTVLRGPDFAVHGGRDPGAVADVADLGITGANTAIADQVRHFVGRSAEFEEVRHDLLDHGELQAKIVAFYLPQFHPFPENDRWWGVGFTEWTNVARGLPRFQGHYQPRIPRDLGFYDLRDDRTLRRQIEMAKRGGVYGFCFYYYNFDGKRLLELPLQRFMADPSLDMPFCLMWANENWTRRWDGAEAEVLMRQSYGEQSAEQLIDDLARHIRDPRYIRIGGRPLVIVYRPNIIPGVDEAIEQWRAAFATRHGEEPLLFMVQAFGSEDPGEFGFDGAVEFPPHKLQSRISAVNDQMTVYDRRMTGQIFRYVDFLKASLSFRPASYPLLRTLFPSWDNDARRQGKGMSTIGSTPGLYHFWLEKMIRYARCHPVQNENLVFINAWNEWAEGTYLEPDVHYGGAYLNETARAVVGLRPTGQKRRLVLVGHDAHPHGAQELLLNIGEMLKREFGCEIEFVLCGDGPLLDRYRAIAPTQVVTAATAGGVLDDLIGREFGDAIVNSLASGFMVELLAERLFKVVSLVHELPELIKARGLEPAARQVAAGSDSVIFPSAVVRDAFAGVVGDESFAGVVRPQGLYKQVAGTPEDRAAVRRELGLPEDAHLVIDVGYGDLRKGLDLYGDLATSFKGENVHFLWVGLTEKPTVEALGSRLSQPNLHFLGQRDDVGRLLAAADVFALTSREDPFPSVVLEALASGLPVVAFEGAGGFTDLFDRAETGRLVPLGDVPAMADAIRLLLKVSDAEKAAEAAARRLRIATEFSFRDYCFWLLQRLDPNLLRVSVVVPNYNYAHYLSQRLNSIFAQTYPVYEIIVLDDASTDASLVTIAEVAAAAGRRVRLEAGQSNSGNVFRQWIKSARLASGDLVWLAEADDASKPEFLAVLAERFRDPDIQFALTDSVTVDAAGNELSDSYQFYYRAVGASMMEKSFAVPSEDFARRFLSNRNLIFNVSAVLLRRERLLDALSIDTPPLDSFSVAGDWMFYLRACLGGGSVAFDARPLNIHRRAQGVTARTRGEVQIDEIRRIYSAFDAIFGTTEEVERKRRDYLDELGRMFAAGS